MPETSNNRFNPKRWTVLTWLAVLLWAWVPFALNYPPSVSYAMDARTGEFTDATYYKSLAELPFPVGWPLYYVRPSYLSASPSPIMPVGAPLPAPALSVVSPFAMVANFVIILATMIALVYLLQRFVFQFSLLTLFKVTLAIALVLGLGRLIGTFAGYRAASWFFKAVYFSPVAGALLAKSYGLPTFGWARFPLYRSPDPRSFEDYDNADDALAAASRLDMSGDWNAALNLYRLAAQRWPEHTEYIQQCIEQVAAKQSLAQT